MNSIGSRACTAVLVLPLNHNASQKSGVVLGVRFKHSADDVARGRPEHKQDSVGRSLSTNHHSREVGGAGVSSCCGASFAADASLLRPSAV